MDIKKTGFILYTANYQETAHFYKSIFGLPILYEKKDITCFDFHGSYLMIELDDEENLLKSQTNGREKFCVRFNVPDVKEACKMLEKHNIPYDYNKFEWGTIAKFRDPDGNLVGLRSAKEHEIDSNR
jgi:Predicted enzyme related to lactoylglutathione lyase